MVKFKQIKNWRIKKELIDKEGKVPGGLMLSSLNGDLLIFSNINQSIGAIMEATSERHMETLFQAYTSYGIWLATNNLININFKPKNREQNKVAPGYTG